MYIVLLGRAYSFTYLMWHVRGVLFSVFLFASSLPTLPLSVSHFRHFPLSLYTHTRYLLAAILFPRTTVHIDREEGESSAMGGGRRERIWGSILPLLPPLHEIQFGFQSCSDRRYGEERMRGMIEQQHRVKKCGGSVFVEKQTKSEGKRRKVCTTYFFRWTLL